MTRPATHGLAPPVLVLCRSCVQYVFEHEAKCPHCAGDPRRPGPAYQAAGFGAIEAIARLDRALEHRGLPSPGDD